MNAQELIARTQQLVGNRGGSTLDDAWYLDRVNSSYRDLATMRIGGRVLRFDELNVSNDRVLSSAMVPNWVSIADSTYSIIGIRDMDNDFDIPEKSLRLLLKRSPTETGRVLQWAMRGLVNAPGYLIWKIPDEDTNIREYLYEHAETLTDSDSSIPVIPIDWHDPIYMLAGAKSAALLGLPDLASRLQQDFLAHVQTKRLPREESQRQRRGFFVGGRSR